MHTSSVTIAGFEQLNVSWVLFMCYEYDLQWAEKTNINQQTKKSHSRFPKHLLVINES